MPSTGFQIKWEEVRVTLEAEASSVLVPEIWPDVVVDAFGADDFQVVYILPGPGPAGPPGPSSQLLQMNAVGPVSALRVVSVAGNGAVLTDPTETEDVALIIGISTNAAADGENLSILRVGTLIDSSWTWIPGLPIFCGNLGQLTQTPPTTVAIRQVAVAASSTVIQVDVGDLFLLEA